MNDIDPVEFGKLINAVETMSRQITAMRTEIDDLKRTITGGKGILTGIVIVASGIGALVTKLFGILAR